ncbi:porin family protein [Bradyrhizobium jicamae]|uniref:outer membrane protein n=1 Tax=Bradyrhizobium jicamae TaxID=280332 RepID=UPI001BAE0B97|nr:outer membrane beta-barrel protein [Bradyrhizobium jicamae]MBR0753223.1 porin family protein [Bradyrhizobium jicamae]
MKTLLLATASLAAIAAVSASAHAADLGARPYSQAPAYAPYAAPIYNWTGFYIGGHLGGAFAGSNAFNGLVLSDYSARLMGGVQAGADWQFHPNVVVGVEGQYSWLGNNALNAIFPTGLVYNNNQRAIASITGRIGYTWGPGLVYVNGGYAYSDNRETLTLGGVNVPFLLSDNHTNGYTVGAGLEYMFAPNWSAKAEYQYYNFGDARFLAPAALVPFGSFHNDEHTIKAGINYRFNLGGQAVARY